MKKLVIAIVALTVTVVVGIVSMVSHLSVYPNSLAEAMLGPDKVVVTGTKDIMPTVLDIDDEADFMSALHYMTHQKVSAPFKWGALEITDERIDELQAVLEGTNFVHQQFYSDTLASWEAGDFENAVTVHNRIWDMQDGTMGEADGLMTKEEEARYIKEHF